MKAAPTVQPLLTFGQCLKNILGARKLSASALSRMMEQKSRNSMFRIWMIPAARRCRRLFLKA